MRSQPVVLPPRQLKLNCVIWLAIAALGLLDAGFMHYMGLKADLPGTPDIFLFMIMCALGALYYRYVQRNDNVFLAANSILQILIAAKLLLIWNYIVAGFNFPLIDDTLIAIDRAMGFNWLRYIKWVDAQSWLPLLLLFAYESFVLMPFFLVFMLILYKETAHVQRIIMIYGLTCFICLTIAGFLPAVAGYVYYDIDVDSLNHMIAAARSHEAHLFAMRNHTLTTIPYPGVGLVTFPSFHATMAILLIYAGLPFCRLRWVIIPLNIAMLFSCINDGGHWLIDVIGGIIIGLAGIWLAERILPRLSPCPPPA